MKIEDIINIHIRITWTLISICFNSNRLLRNSEYERTFISANEVINYAVGFLEYTENDDIVSFAILRNSEEEDILNILKKLSESENGDYCLEFRKFRTLYIYENLPSKNDDFMHGILKLSELWDKFGFPEDSPNIYFEFKNYSQEKFNKLLDIHNSWLKSEFEFIRNES
jgi:hypothetical protein